LPKAQQKTQALCQLIMPDECMQPAFQIMHLHMSQSLGAGNILITICIVKGFS